MAREASIRKMMLFFGERAHSRLQLSFDVLLRAIADGWFQTFECFAQLIADGASLSLTGVTLPRPEETA